MHPELKPEMARVGMVRRLPAAMLVGLYRTLNSLIGVFRFILWPRRRPAFAGSICVYRTGNVGDLLCALPALRAIREAYPSARIVLLSTPGSPGLPSARSVFASVDWIDEFIDYLPSEMFRFGSAVRILSDLRARRFDVFVELSNDMAQMRTLLRNMLFARTTGARWAGGWTVGTIRLGLQKQSEEIDFPNEVTRLLRAVGQFGIETDRIGFELPLSDSHRSGAEALLKMWRISAGTPLVALAPGAKRPDNRWPLERFAAVGRELTGRGFRVLVLGSKDESESARVLCNAIGEECKNAAGLTDIPTAGALLQRCRLVVCNDSGIQHLASAVGTPSVAIFSYWQLRGKWYPHHRQAIVLQKQVECHTCYLKTCPVGNRCVLEISTCEVAEAVLEVLGQRDQ